MSFIIADRVKETSTTTSTGTLTLAGASTGFRAFSAVCANNDTAAYVISSPGGSEWETGIGTWTTGNNLARTTVLQSSNAGSVVSLSAGTKDVYLAVLSAQIAGTVDDGNSSTADTIDFSIGPFHKSTLTGNVTYTFTAPAAGSVVVLKVIQGSGPYTITWPAAVHWPSGTAPTLTVTNGKVDVFTFLYMDSVYYSVTSGQNYTA